MIFSFEFLGHATVDFAILLDTATERYALQVALERVIPLVIRAHQLFLVAMALTAELHATVGAYVFNDIEFAVHVPCHDNRALTDDGALEITRVRYLSLQAYIGPVAFIEQTIQFFFVDGVIGIGPKGNAT